MEMKLKLTPYGGFHVVMDNGVTLSVQIGPGTYSDNHNAHLPAAMQRGGLPASSTAEIAVWLKDYDMTELPNGDTVAGRVPAERVFSMIPDLLTLEAPTEDEMVAVVGRYLEHMES